MTELFKNQYRIPSTRLANWDYSTTGDYFVTICTQNRKYYFGDVINKKMHLSKMGEIADQYWHEIPKHFSSVKLDEYIVMPNHVHGIVIIRHRGRDKAMPCLYDNNGKNIGSKRFQNQGKGSLSAIIGSFKSIVTRTINRNFQDANFSWQSRFYEHIIRNKKSLYRIRKYIQNNPLKWARDRNNPENLFM